MLPRALITLVLAFSLLGLHPQRIVSQELKISELPISMQIEYFSSLYGVDDVLIKKIIQCESQGNDNAVGDGGRAYGLMQYHKATFERHEEELGEDLDYYSSYDQIKLGTWAIANGKGNEWTTYRSIKNGGKYSFYSTLLKRDFTVTCK